MIKNTEFKEKWIEALRSGKYKQTTRKLHNRKDDTYCCLGVACRVYEQMTGLLVLDSISDANLETGMLPKEVETFAGNQDDPVLFTTTKENEFTRAIWELNDRLEFDFNQIAGIIEEQL